MNARRRKPPLGQHFLVSEPVIQQIIDAIGPRKNDTMVEIGPGPGVLTERLAERVSELHAIELDVRLVKRLKRKFISCGLHVHHCDALEFDYSSLASPDNRKLRFVGNLPYSISTELILLLANRLELAEDICFMVQKEVAERLAASCGTKQYGRLTVSVSRKLSVDVLFDVAPDAFSPPPDVQSSVIHMRPKLTKDTRVCSADRFDELVRVAFSKRRKTLRNALAGNVSETAFERAGIDAGLRAENLTVEQFEQLAQYSMIES